MLNKERFLPYPGDNVWLLCLALCAMVIAYLIIPGAAVAMGSEPGGIVAATASALGMLAGIGMVLVGTRRVTASWRETLELLKLERFLWCGVWRALWLAPLLLLSAGVLTTVWMFAGMRLGIKFDMPPATQALMSGTWAARIGFAVAAIVLAPVFEEIVFRRALYGALAERCSGAWAAALTALAFAAMHLTLVQLPGLWWIAWNWQHVVQRDNTLWSSIVCHAFNNLITVGLVLWVLDANRAGMEFGM